MTDQPHKAETYSSEFIVGMVGGLLVGGALAIWYAPRSGEATRERIKAMTLGRAQRLVERIQGETVDQSIEEGRALAYQHRAREAKLLPE